MINMIQPPSENLMLRAYGYGTPSPTTAFLSGAFNSGLDMYKMIEQKKRQDELMNLRNKEMDMKNRYYDQNLALQQQQMEERKRVNDANIERTNTQTNYYKTLNETATQLADAKVSFNQWIVDHPKGTMRDFLKGTEYNNRVKSALLDYWNDIQKQNKKQYRNSRYNRYNNRSSQNQTYTDKSLARKEANYYAKFKSNIETTLADLEVNKNKYDRNTYLSKQTEVLNNILTATARKNTEEYKTLIAKLKEKGLIDERGNLTRPLPTSFFNSLLTDLNSLYQ